MRASVGGGTRDGGGSGGACEQPAASIRARGAAGAAKHVRRGFSEGAHLARYGRGAVGRHLGATTSNRRALRALRDERRRVHRRWLKNEWRRPPSRQADHTEGAFLANSVRADTGANVRADLRGAGLGRGRGRALLGARDAVMASRFALSRHGAVGRGLERPSLPQWRGSGEEVVA
eukprot:2452868-Prymnesium_polylepis.1